MCLIDADPVLRCLAVPRLFLAHLDLLIDAVPVLRCLAVPRLFLAHLDLLGWNKALHPKTRDVPDCKVTRSDIK